MNSKKKHIRKLIHSIPDMVKAQMVNQAFETEKIIAATFNFSDEIKELMRNTPQNYLEEVASVYSDLLYKAYKGGLNNAEIKSTTVTIQEDVEDLDHEIDVRMPFSYTLKKDLNLGFRQATKKFLETVPDTAALFSQFSKDLEKAYKEGVREYLDVSKEEPESVEEKIEDVQKVEEEAQEKMEENIEENIDEPNDDLEDELEKEITEEIEENIEDKDDSDDLEIEVEVEVEDEEDEEDE